MLLAHPNIGGSDALEIKITEIMGYPTNKLSPPPKNDKVCVDYMLFTNWLMIFTCLSYFFLNKIKF